MSAGLTLHPVGLNEEEKKILSVAMNVLLACGCGVRFSEKLTDDTVAVIDVDSDEGRIFYESTNDGLPHRTVVIAGDDRIYHASGLIRKPLRVQTLRNVLSELSGQEESQDSSHYDAGYTNTDAVQPAPLNRRSLPNDSIFYALVNAVANEQYLEISSKSGQYQLLVHGPTRHVYTNLSPKAVEQAVKLAADDMQIAMLDEFAFMKQARGLVSIRIEKLLWKADESGALGYPPVNYDRQAGFRLTDWPRFDVKHIKPQYLTLSAIMTRQSMTPESLAQMTGIGVDTIFDFYHAAQACGLLEKHEPQEEVKMVEQAPPVRMLVARIAKKLGLSFF